MPSHLIFQLYGTSDSGKTNRWEVRSAHDGCLLGLINWYAPWRRYAVTPQDHCLFDAMCLREIANFIDKQMEARRHGRHSC